MFSLQMPPAYFLHWQDKLGGKCNTLSPLPGLTSHLKGIEPQDEPDARLPVSEDELVGALEVLMKPSGLVKARQGGNLVDPDEFRVCLGNDAVVFAAITAAGNIFLQGFESLDEWLEWVLKPLDPSGNTREGESPASGQFEYAQLVHLLHAADMYRRCIYRSMLDYVPKEAAAFSQTDYSRSLRESIASIDHRWILPCLLMMTPEAVPERLDGLDEAFDSLSHWGLVEPRGQEEDGQAWRFTEYGRLWADDLMRGWTVALGINVEPGGDNTETARSGLFLLATIRNIHTFRISPAGVEAAATDLPSAARQVRALIDPAIRVPAADTAPEPESQPARSQSAHKFCTHCGSPVQPRSRFCTHCGAEIG